MELETEWITVTQAMNILQITSRTTLYKYAHKHNIRVSKPMGRVYFNRHDLVNSIDFNSVKLGI